MNSDASRCPVCGGMASNGTTTFTVDLRFGVVVVRDVPAQVCDRCGDATLSDEVAESLELIVRKARARRPEVSITRWQDGGV